MQYRFVVPEWFRDERAPQSTLVTEYMEGLKLAKGIEGYEILPQHGKGAQAFHLTFSVPADSPIREEIGRTFRERYNAMSEEDYDASGRDFTLFSRTSGHDRRAYQRTSPDQKRFRLF